MILERGNMWSVFNKTDIFMITTNPIIKKDGSVVMGRGIALEAKTRFTLLPYQFASALKDSQTNVGYIGTFESQRVYWFMVKDHWAKDADLNIIQKSCAQLKNIANLQQDRIDLNFPGVGNGKLNKESVLPLLLTLPDNVHIWDYAS